MNQTIEVDSGIKHWTTTWVFTMVVVFFILIFFGLGMRFSQSGLIELQPDFFYAFMTLHGLGMVGTLFTAGLAMIWYIISRHVQCSKGLPWLVYITVILAVVGLLFATLAGKFGAGWYVLYPLPFIQFWYNWSIVCAIVSVMALVIVWLLWQLDMLRAMLNKYGLYNMMGWQYLGGGGGAITEVPPAIIIASVSLIAGAVTTVFGGVVMVLYFAQWLDPTMSFDALIMKNMMFLFGHTIVNITMYFGIAAVYDILPIFTGRPWKSNRIVAIAWNFTFILVNLAFLHHLYLDFAQPLFLQYVGQIASYMSVVPATVVTVFGVIAQLYRSGTKMEYVPLALLFGIVGWLVGGFAAVVDSTIMVNTKFHNTLWVPAHFHTYYIVGFVFIFFAFIYYLVGARSEQTAKLSLWTMLIGGYGFVLMFFMGGIKGVPRRYSSYADIKAGSIAEYGQEYAMVSIFFISILVVGVSLYFIAVCGNLNTYVVQPLKGRGK